MPFEELNANLTSENGAVSQQVIDVCVDKSYDISHSREVRPEDYIL